MKKVSYLLLSLCLSGFTSLMAQPSVTAPQEGVDYNIQQATGLVLTRNINADAPQVKNPSGGWDQVFHFENVPNEDDTYYIKNSLNDEYLVRLETDGWSMGWVADPNQIVTLNNAKYQIVTLAATTEYVQIKNRGSNSVIGSDKATDPSDVYGNKNGLTEPKYQWRIKLYSSEVDKTALNNLLTEATALYSGTIAGTASDQYPADARIAFKSIIDEAQGIFDNAQATQTAVNGILTDLTAALATYKKAVYPYQPNTALTYLIQHSSEFYFTNGGQIAAGSYAADQYFKFVAVANTTAIYNIQSVASGQYLKRAYSVDVANGKTYAYGIEWSEDPTDDKTQFEIKSTGTGYYTIRNIAELLTFDDKPVTNNNLGTDLNDANSGVYLDKSGSDGKHFWKFVDIEHLPVVKTNLEAAITKAAEFLQYAAKGEGSDQYPAAEYDALTDAKTAAETVVANAEAIQDDVTAATLALNNALTACIAAVHPYSVDTEKNYYIQHYGGLYLGEYSDDTHTNAVAVFEKTSINDHLVTFVAVPEGGDSIYNITLASLPDQYLTRSKAPHLDGNGEPEEGKYDDYALLWGDDATTDFARFIIKKVGVQNFHTIKCITPGPQRPNSYIGTDAATEKSGASVDKDGKNTNHYWTIVETEDVAGISNAKVADKASVYAANQQLTVTNLEGWNNVAVYTINGQLISSTAVSGATFTQSLSAGAYLVVVNGKTPYSGIVIVK